MNICKYHHEEIVYSGWGCPLCAANETIQEQQTQIQDLEAELDDLE